MQAILHKPQRVFSYLRRKLLSHRRLLAAICLGVASLAAVQLIQHPGPALVTRWVLTTKKSNGDLLVATDLVKAEFLAKTAPIQPSYDELIGNRINSPQLAGTIITATNLLAKTELPAHTVLTPVRITDPEIVNLLKPGQLIDLIFANPKTGEAELLGTGIRVISVPISKNKEAQAPAGKLILVAAPIKLAAKISISGMSGLVTITWSSG